MNKHSIGFVHCEQKSKKNVSAICIYFYYFTEAFCRKLTRFNLKDPIGYSMHVTLLTH